VLRLRDYAPDHVHLLIRKHRDDAETMIENLQKFTRAAILAADRSISPEHPLWTAGG
jgi:REP element-mobilizing transposase RayT